MSLLSRLGAWWRRDRVGLWYHPEYAAPALAATSRVEHVDPHRGERVLGRLLQEGVLRPVDVRTPPSASVGQLRRFHSLRYLERVSEASALAHVFGLPPEDVDIESLLASSRRAVGGTVSALGEAAHRRLDVAINLGGGFHHAEPEQGSGFCVFNDIGVAIADLRAGGFPGRVAVVDLDFHQGNGNTVAFANDPDVFVYSIHGAVWTRTEANGREIHLTGPVNDRRYLSALRTSLETELRRFRPLVVVYIAGADVLAGDQLGSFWLSPRGAFDRDCHVYRVVRDLGVPLVVTLGGGYSPRAWQVHFRLIRALLTGDFRFDGRPPPSLRSRYARVASSLDPRELRGDTGDDIEITEEDVLGALGVAPTNRRFLDYYSNHGLEVAFERYGVMDRIRARGFRDLSFELDPSDPGRQVLRIRGRSLGRRDLMLLVELVLRRRYKPAFIPGRERVEWLFVEWLLLQDPTRSFSLARPPLPGQDHPGLGIALEIQEILVQACRRLELAGLMDRPAHYHNALYCAAEWRFVDPSVEGRFRALRAALAGLELVEATYAVEQGRMRLDDGEPVRWLAEDHVLPVDPELKAYFESAEYRAAVLAEKARLLEAGLCIGPGPIGPVAAQHGQG